MIPNQMTTAEIDRWKEQWLLIPGEHGRYVFLKGENVYTSDDGARWTASSGVQPYAEPAYTPTVQRIDWLGELRETKRQALIGAAILGVLVLVFIAGCLRWAGVL